MFDPRMHPGDHEGPVSSHKFPLELCCCVQQHPKLPPPFKRTQINWFLGLFQHLKMFYALAARERKLKLITLTQLNREPIVLTHLSRRVKHLLKPDRLRVTYEIFKSSQIILGGCNCCKERHYRPMVVSAPTVLNWVPLPLTSPSQM